MEAYTMGYATDNFGMRFKYLRELAGLNQAEMAEYLGVSRGAISYYENGERTPDIEFLEKVQNFFDLPYEYVLGRTENAKEEFAFCEEAFGLSDTALNTMDANNMIGHIISSFLEHDSFNHFYGLLERLDMEKYYIAPNSVLYDPAKKPLTRSEIEYISFLISNSLQSIIADILDKEYHSELFANLRPEDIEKKLSDIENAFIELDIQEKEKEAALEKTMEEFHESGNVKFSIRKKVHAALGNFNYPK